MASPAEREAHSRCRETCPAVDDAFGNLHNDLSDYIGPAVSNDVGRVLERCCERVKEVGTLKLRDALISACDDLLDTQRDLETAQERIRELESMVEDLRMECSQLSEQVLEAAA